MKHIRALDSLRAFAVFFVILHHWGPHFHDYHYISRLDDIIIPNGGFGVVLFFVLSGYLISNILLKERYGIEHRNNLGIIKNFFVRRALRIFPIYYLTLFFVYLVNYPTVREYFFYHLSYTSNILFYVKHSWLQGVSHFWSLSVEEQFYLFWPWFVLFLSERYLKYLFPLSIITGIVSTWLFYHYTAIVSIEDPALATILTPTCLSAFGLGGILAYKRMYEPSGLKLFEKRINIAALVALVFYFYFKVTGIYFLQHILLNSVISLAVINYALTPKNNFFYKKILENNFLIEIGKISYGIYIYHNILPYFLDHAILVFTQHFKLIALGDWLTSYYVAYPIHIVAVFLFSWLSFELIEKRIMKLKDHFKYSSK